MSSRVLKRCCEIPCVAKNKLEHAQSIDSGRCSQSRQQMQSCLNWKHSTPSQDLILMFALFGTLHACSDDGTRLMFGRSCKDLENGIQNKQKDRQSRQFGYSTVPFLGWESSTTCRHNIFPKLRRRKNFPYSYFCRRTSSCDPLTSCDGIT